MFIGGDILPANRSFREQPMWIPAPSAGFVPSAYGTVLIDLNPALGVLVSGSPPTDGQAATAWTDQVASITLSAITTGLTWKANIFGSLPSMRGGSGSMKGSGGPFSKPVTFLAVLKNITSGGADQYCLMDSGTSFLLTFFPSGGNKPSIFDGSTLASSSGLSQGVVTSIFDASSVGKIYINGTQTASGSTGNIGALNGITVGGFRTGGNLFSGDYGRIIVYNGALGATAIANASADAAAYYGV